MEPGNSNVAVVYLIWVPYGIGLFENFIESYNKYASGCPHQLILLFNGVPRPEDAEPFEKIGKDHNLEYEAFFYRSGQDLEVYSWLASQIDAPNILFLNSFSVILGDTWLLHMVRALDDKNIGVVAPTGSYESYYHSVFLNNSWKWDSHLSKGENYRKYKLLLKAWCYWRFLFPGFPNPHFRTSAFLIRRELFLRLKIGTLRNKFMAYQLESGFKSLSRQVLKKGFKILIVGKDGRTFDIEFWKTSDVFWQGQQNNLLISDKQTESYRLADHFEKDRMSSIAWGN